MKASIPKPGNGTQYTAEEIVHILERAKALDVRFIRVAGFEATWGLERREEPQPPVNPTHPFTVPSNGPPLGHQSGWQDRRPQAEGPRRAGFLCPACDYEMSESTKPGGKPFCKRCYARKMEEKEARRDR